MEQYRLIHFESLVCTFEFDFTGGAEISQNQDQRITQTQNEFPTNGIPQSTQYTGKRLLAYSPRKTRIVKGSRSIVYKHRIETRHDVEIGNNCSSSINLWSFDSVSNCFGKPQIVL